MRTSITSNRLSTHPLRKRLAALVLLLVLFILPLSRSFASGASHIPCTCLPGQHCECFIQKGDEGNAVKAIIERLIIKQYLAKKTPTGVFSEEVETAVMKFQSDNNLEVTGTMDDDILTLLLWDMLPEELDAVQGTFGDSCDTEYIPTDGGKKRHSSPTCSGMYDPRKVSIRNAEELGFDACKRCH